MAKAGKKRPNQPDRGVDQRNQEKLQKLLDELGKGIEDDLKKGVRDPWDILIRRGTQLLPIEPEEARMLEEWLRKNKEEFNEIQGRHINDPVSPGIMTPYGYVPNFGKPVTKIEPEGPPPDPGPPPEDGDLGGKRGDRPKGGHGGKRPGAGRPRKPFVSVPDIYPDLPGVGGNIHGGRLGGKSGGKR